MKNQQPNEYPVPTSLEEALAANLGTDGLIRLKTVDLAIEFWEGKSPKQEDFIKSVEDIYNFLTNLQTYKNGTRETALH